MKDLLTARLAEAHAKQHELLQQRARLTELLDQTLAQLNASQGRIAELSELLALSDASKEPAAG